MDITQKVTGNIAILSISGKMMDHLDTSGLYDRMKYLVNQDVNQVIINLKDVKWMNSNGIGALMGCLSFLEAHNCDLKLVQMSQKIRDVLAMMDILHYFNHFKSINNAIVTTIH
jgi:anti-sigma B factor antagonist